MVSVLSFCSDFSEDYLDVDGNCFLCKVKLNQIGIHHTRAAKCIKCFRYICVNCISTSSKYLENNERVCKDCGHKAILFSLDEAELEKIAREKNILLDELQKERKLKELAYNANIEFIKEINEISRRFEESIKEKQESLEEAKNINQGIANKKSEILHLIDRKKVEEKLLMKKSYHIESDILDFDFEFSSVDTEEDRLKKLLIFYHNKISILKKKLACIRLEDILKANVKRNKHLCILINLLEIQSQDYQDLLHKKSAGKLKLNQDLTSRKCMSCDIF